MRRFKYLVLLFTACSVLSSCTKPTTGEDDTTSFLVELKGGTATPTPVDPRAIWKIPKSVTFTFQACLTGRASRKDIYNQNFTVENPESKEIFQVRTNEKNGCFSWKEPIPYNHFAGQSGWVTIERDVVGAGVNTGRQRVRIAVNPWAAGSQARDAGKAVVSLKSGESDFLPVKVYAMGESNLALAGDLQGNARLLVQNVKIKAIPEGEGGDWVALLVEVTMDPVVQMLDANGQTKYEEIQDGEFDLTMQVLASNVGAAMNQKVLLLGADNHTVARSVNGKLKAEFKVRQERKANQGNLELVLKVMPRSLSGNHRLAAFNGLFRFGAGTVVEDGGGSLANMCMENSQSCAYDKIVEQAKNFDALVKQGYVRGNERYIFSTLKLRFTSILPGETTTQRTVVYTATTCITDNQTGRSLANTPMVIRYIKKDDGKVDVEPEKIEKSTDESGCLSWNGQAFHKYYEPEEFFEKEVVIEKGQIEKKDESGKVVMVPSFERHLKFYLNPWDDKFTFGWDSREFTKEFFDEIRSRKKIPSRFFLSDYNYRTVRFLYNIDQFMDLEVKKWVLMGMVPQVLRYSGIINARKMVEHLRDGIYLMKVAIQKSYLDPRDNSGWLLRNNPEHQAELVNIGDKELAAKEFITTNMALVRVVDGVIVYPIEFTMRDLRLMRVRSNMVIQLETVDERLVQAYHVFRKFAIMGNGPDASNPGSPEDDLEAKLRKFKELLNQKPGQSLEDVRKELESNEIPPDLQMFEQKRQAFARSPDLTAARKDLEAKTEKIQTLVKESLVKLKSRLEAGGNIGLEPNGRSKEQNNKIISDNFELNPRFLDDLRAALSMNDFSTVALPKKEEIDLNIFTEKDSGLETRSFVGPVIFLSNAYSDSVRATDNLDEANCINESEGNKRDALARSLEQLELDVEGSKLTSKAEDALNGNRQNNAYQYNKYFGSLNNLCYASVDKLMVKEKELKKNWVNAARAASLKSNFVETFNMDFVSLTNEPLMKLKPDCHEEFKKCLEPTTKNVVSAEKLAAWINTGLEESMDLHAVAPRLQARFNGTLARSYKFNWEPAEYDKIFFERSVDSTAAICNMLANRIAENMRQSQLTKLPLQTMREKLIEKCTSEEGLVHDIKLRVEQTGKYTFLGGLNLNLNVGEGFSVGTSTGWSAGFDLVDMVGGASGLTGASLLKTATNVMKPVSVKFGTGLSSSEGTSVSESTYLVSQIAGFDVELQNYERCAAIRLSDRSVDRLMGMWGSWLTRKLGVAAIDNTSEASWNALKRGMFVCEGASRVNNKPRTVKESYFYFTQHFTEGDMLDQADLYNHPWLLGMRGMRDFSIFVTKIRAQELADLPEFLAHVTGLRKPRAKGWALEHLNAAFRNTMPTFPGFYTLLDRNEPSLDVFALEQAQKRLSKADDDKNKDIIRPKLLKP